MASRAEPWELIDAIWLDHARGAIDLAEAVGRAQVVRMNYNLGLTNAGITELLTDSVRPLVRRRQADNAIRDARALVARALDLPEDVVLAGLPEPRHTDGKGPVWRFWSHAFRSLTGGAE